jgi:glucuronokinase
MRIIRQHAFARAGLIGNPSDGYHGKTISVIVPRFRAEVVLYEWPEIEILWSQEDHSRFKSLRDLDDDVRLHGYYGGIRLVKAAIRRFVRYCDARRIALHDRTFSIRYQSNIPRQVGLAGSSAIIIATLRALIEFYGVSIPAPVLPSLALSVEKEELKISAGLQDRVIQFYEGLVYMDFAEDRMTEQHGFPCGVYEPLRPDLLPPLYIAYSTQDSEPTEVTHGPLGERYRRGDPAVRAAMLRFAELTVQAREALLQRDHAALARLMNENFDLRRSIMDLAPAHIRMVETARRSGASAKFAGSGGAIIGTYSGDAMFTALQNDLTGAGCRVFRLDPMPKHESRGLDSA